MKPTWQTTDGRVQLYRGDNLDICNKLKAKSMDAVVTDPPYGIGFMGQDWDENLPKVTNWRAILQVLRPGRLGLVFGGTRKFHRLGVMLEDAGFEIRDCIMWLYGEGMPKGKAQLKPSWEPIWVARRPGPRILPYQVDDCRVGVEKRFNPPDGNTGKTPASNAPINVTGYTGAEVEGRWPANAVHDGSEEVESIFSVFGESGAKPGRKGRVGGHGGIVKLCASKNATEYIGTWPFDPGGSPSRFFYCAKPGPDERAGNDHPTRKPVALMSWLIRLVTKEMKLVFDPFMGSGTTGVACLKYRRCFIGIERDPKYFDLCVDRLKEAHRQESSKLLY